LAQRAPGLINFSDAEYQRRRAAVAHLCEVERVDALVVYGTSANARQAQAQVDYLTGFLGHQDAYVLFTPGREPILLVQYYNHVPNAKRVAHADVRWGGARSIDAVADELAGLTGPKRIGLVGPIAYQDYQRLHARLTGGTLVDLTPAFLRLRLVKSAEELEWMQQAASITDQALTALTKAAVPGATELDLQAVAVSAAIHAGGQPHFLYLSSTPMANPDRIVPQQDLTARRLEQGDVVILELSSSYGGYSGQILRTLTIEAQMTDLFRRLHEAAWETFHAIAATIRPGATADDVVQAAQIIEDRGFTIRDDLVHGYGGGYLPPILRTRSTSHGPVPDFVFEQNMTVVIQPNVVTTDGRAGVQVGELVRVTADPVARLHGGRDVKAEVAG
jgi:Xaa-Pro aminopeptidase